jgi:hypothetical protein
MHHSAPAAEAVRALASEGSGPVETVLALCLLGLPLAAPVALLAGILVLAVRAVRACGDLRSLLTSGTLALVVLTALAGTLTALAVGWAEGFSLMPAEKLCAVKGVGGDRLVQKMVPASVRCVSRDGSGGGELVPGWVNPAAFAGVSVAVLALGGMVGVRRSRRQERR